MNIIFSGKEKYINYKDWRITSHFPKSCIIITKMKKKFPLFLILILMLSCKKNSAIKSHNLEFQLLTDTTIQTYDDNDSSKLKFNLLAATKDNQILDKYYSGNGNTITINSIETVNGKPLFKITTSYNHAYLNTVSAPFWADINEWLIFEDNAFKKVFSYPQKQGNQEGPNIELLESKIEANHMTLIYDFQQYGFERAAGFGTITIEINQQDEKYYLSKFEYDVNGHFRVVDEKDDIWVPDQNGDKLVPRDIKAEDFFKHFSFTNLNYEK